LTAIVQSVYFCDSMRYFWVVGFLKSFVCLCIVMSNTYRLHEQHGRCLIRGGNCLSFVSTWVHPCVLLGSVLLIFFVFCVPITCLYVLSLDTTAGGLFVPEGIIHPVVSVSTLTWFIRYIYYWNLQFINNVIIIKIILAMLVRPFSLLLQNSFKLLGFSVFRYWAYLMMFIPDTHRVP
jgi:hypothetical protein